MILTKIWIVITMTAALDYGIVDEIVMPKDEIVTA